MNTRSTRGVSRPSDGHGRHSAEPVLISDFDLADEVPSLSSERAQGHRYTRAALLVRIHGLPVGWLTIPLGVEGIDARSLADRVESELGEAVRAHLDADRLDTQETGSEALALARASSTGSPPSCINERSTFLEGAPALTVVIPTRNRTTSLTRCIESIRACEYPRSAFKILVVDNVPMDSSTERLVSEYEGEPVVAYAREDLPGSANARNRGMELVETDLVAFTDDDAVVDPLWLVQLARAFESEEAVSCVTGSLLPLELETPAQVWFEEYGGFSRGFERRVFDLGPHRPRDVALYPYSAGIFGTGNNMAFRTEALREIGNFDPALGNGTPALGGVDSEVLLRTVLSGLRIVYEPTALAWHTHRAEYDDLRRQLYSYGAGLSAYLLKTLLSRPSLITDFVMKLPAGLHFALSPSSSKNASKGSGYPRDLTLSELRGILYGPLGYLRSRRRFGPHRVPSREVTKYE